MSFKGQKLPNITPSPPTKVKQVTEPKKELRPILTSAISKIAEDFVASNYIRPTGVREEGRQESIWYHFWFVHCAGCHTYGA